MERGGLVDTKICDDAYCLCPTFTQILPSPINFAGEADHNRMVEEEILQWDHRTCHNAITICVFIKLCRIMTLSYMELSVSISLMAVKNFSEGHNSVTASCLSPWRIHWPVAEWNIRLTPCHNPRPNLFPFLRTLKELVLLIWHDKGLSWVLAVCWGMSDSTDLKNRIVYTSGPQVDECTCDCIYTCSIVSGSWPYALPTAESKCPVLWSSNSSCGSLTTTNKVWAGFSCSVDFQSQFQMKKHDHGIFHHT